MRYGDDTQIPCGSGLVVQLLGSSDKRVRLEIRVDSGVGYAIDRAGQPAGSGMPITPDRPLTLDVETYGDMVKHPWFGSVVGAGLNFGVLDVQEYPAGRVG